MPVRSRAQPFKTDRARFFGLGVECDGRHMNLHPVLAYASPNMLV